MFQGVISKLNQRVDFYLLPEIHPTVTTHGTLEATKPLTTLAITQTQHVKTEPLLLY